MRWLMLIFFPMAGGPGLSLSCLSWSISNPFGLLLLLWAAPVSHSRVSDSGLERQTGWAGQPGGWGSAWASLGALRAPVAGHRKLLTLPRRVSCYDPVSTLEFRSWLQQLPHAASRHSRALLPPQFCPRRDSCLECFSSLAWSAP